MKIYVTKDRIRSGPYTLRELNKKIEIGEYGQNDHASLDGTNWIVISDVPGVVLQTSSHLKEENKVPGNTATGLVSQFPKRKFLSEKGNRPKLHHLRFTGTGSEFFGVWIVNLLLTVCTLGIYSAWAKVRTINYFYGNTSLDGSCFSFVANPIAILKGRIIAFAFFGAYTFFQTVEPVVSLVIMLAVFPLIPLLVVRSMRFRMQNTEYRGLKFNFTGSVGYAYSIFFGGVILTYISLGILFPWWECQKKQYLLGNLRYGKTRFESFPQTGVFYKYAGICILMGFGASFLMILFSFAVGPLLGEYGIMAVVLFLYFFLGIVGAYWHVCTTNHVMESTNLPGVSFGSRMTTSDFVALWVVNIILLVLTLGLATPWVMVRNARYRIHCTTVLAQDLDSFIEGQIESTSALGEELGESIDLDIGI
jgi:uncharacterized membrane protein YjgN (DUF898 family)